MVRTLLIRVKLPTTKFVQTPSSFVHPTTAQPQIFCCCGTPYQNFSRRPHTTKKKSVARARSCMMFLEMQCFREALADAKTLLSLLLLRYACRMNAFGQVVCPMLHVSWLSACDCGLAFCNLQPIFVELLVRTIQ